MVKSNTPIPLSNSIANPSQLRSIEETKRELKQAVEGSSDVLCMHSTVLSTFPDTFEIDRAKVTVTKRGFFRMAEIISISMQDILTVSCTVGPFLGSVIITSRVVNAHQTTHIGKFWRKDAERMERIVQGYIIALHRGIDCSNVPTKELVETLANLGGHNHS